MQFFPLAVKQEVGEVGDGEKSLVNFRKKTLRSRFNIGGSCESS